MSLLFSAKAGRTHSSLYFLHPFDWDEQRTTGRAVEGWRTIRSWALLFFSTVQEYTHFSTANAGLTAPHSKHLHAAAVNRSGTVQMLPSDQAA